MQPGAHVAESSPSLASHTRRFLTASLGYSPSVVLPAVANFLFIVVFTRLLGPVELGRYFLTVSVVTFSAVVLGTWFQQALLRFDSGGSPERAAERATFYLFFLLLSLSATVFAWFAYWGLRTAVPGRIPAFAVIMVPLIAADVWYRTLLSSLQADGASTRYSIASVSLTVGRYVAALGLFSLAGMRSYLALLYGWLLAEGLVILWLAGSLGFRSAARRLARTPRAEWKRQFGELRRYAIYGVPMARLALGLAYVDGYALIALALVGSVVGSLALYVGKGLEVHRRTGLLLGANLGSLAVTVAFNVLAIRRWGYVGAGYGYCAGSLMYLGLVYAAARSVMRVQVPWGFAAVIAAIVATSAIVGAACAGRLGLLGGGLGTLVGAALTWPLGISMLRRHPSARMQLKHVGQTLRTVLRGLMPRA